MLGFKWDVNSWVCDPHSTQPWPPQLLALSSFGSCLKAKQTALLCRYSLCASGWVRCLKSWGWEWAVNNYFWAGGFFCRPQALTFIWLFSHTSSCRHMYQYHVHWATSWVAVLMSVWGKRHRGSDWHISSCHICPCGTVLLTQTLLPLQMLSVTWNTADAFHIWFSSITSLKRNIISCLYASLLSDKRTTRRTNLEIK